MASLEAFYMQSGSTARYLLFLILVIFTDEAERDLVLVGILLF